MKILITSSLGFYLLLTALASLAATAIPTFEELDINGDGYTSKTEAKAYKDMSKKWAKVDTNKDGRADIDEFTRLESS